jgi:hypothetical protein
LGSLHNELRNDCVLSGEEKRRQIKEDEGARTNYVKHQPRGNVKKAAAAGMMGRAAFNFVHQIFGF